MGALGVPGHEPAGRTQKAGQDREQRTLSGAVGTDEANDASRSQGDIDVVQDLPPGKPPADRARRQQGRVGAAVLSPRRSSVTRFKWASA